MRFAPNTYVVAFPDGDMATFTPDEIDASATMSNPWPVPNGRGFNAVRYNGKDGKANLIMLGNPDQGIHEGERQAKLFRGLYVYNTGLNDQQYVGLPLKRRLPSDMTNGMLQAEFAANGSKAARELKAELDTSYVLIGSADGKRPALDIHDRLPDDKVPGSDRYQWIDGSEWIPIAHGIDLFEPKPREEVDRIFEEFERDRLDLDIYWEPRYQGSLSYFGDQRSPKDAVGLRRDLALYLRTINDRTGEPPNDSWYRVLAPRLANEFYNGHYDETLWLWLRACKTKRLEDYGLAMQLTLGKCAFGLSRHPDSPYFGRWHGEKGYACVGDSYSQKCPPTKQWTEGLALACKLTDNPFLIDTLRFRFEGVLREQERGGYPHQWDGNYGARIGARHLEELAVVARYADHFGWHDLATKSHAVAAEAVERYLGLLQDGRPYWISGYRPSRPRGAGVTSPWMQSQLVTAIYAWGVMLDKSEWRSEAVRVGVNVWNVGRFEYKTRDGAGPTTILTHHYRSDPTVDDKYVNTSRDGVVVGMLRVLAHELGGQYLDDFRRMKADMVNWRGTSPKRNDDPRKLEDIAIDDVDNGTGDLKMNKIFLSGALTIPGLKQQEPQENA